MIRARPVWERPTCIWSETKAVDEPGACRTGAWHRACRLIGRAARGVPHHLIAVIVECPICQQVPTPEAGSQPSRRALPLRPPQMSRWLHRKAALVPCCCWHCSNILTLDTGSVEGLRDCLLLFRDQPRPEPAPSCRAPMSSKSQQPLALSALRGVVCRYQPRSDLRYAQAPLGNKHTSRHHITEC